MGTDAIPKSEEAVSADVPSDIEQKIIRQIEYYFGNYNLSRDKFLKEQLNVDDGWVPLETLIKFNRLKKLTEDFAVITEALKKSSKQLMEVSEDNQKVRRRTAVTLPPEDSNKKREEFDSRTLYVKGFKRSDTLDDLLEYFYEHNVEHVYMRSIPNQKEKRFKGSVFATFETCEDAEKFLEKKGIKYGGTELLKEWKVDYIKRKDEEFAQLKAEKEKKLLKRAEMAKEEKRNGTKGAEIEMVPGCLLKLTNLDKDTTREHIKEFFEPHGTLVYVDYSKGKPAAVLRFETAEASSVFEKMEEEDGERKAKIESCTAIVSLIEGDEEKEYWKNIAISRAQSREKFKGKNFGSKGRFKNWGGKRQRGRNDDNNEKDDVASEPAKKKSKIEKSEDAGESASMENSSETNAKEASS